MPPHDIPRTLSLRATPAAGPIAGAVVGTLVEQACRWEATAPKPGNVHPHAAFADMTYDHMLSGARVIGDVCAAAGEQSVGALVREAVQRIQSEVGTNTHLGTILLLAPLARAACLSGNPLRDAVDTVLATLRDQDARDVYAAIRQAQPGGLGKVRQYDVHSAAPPDLMLAMRAAAATDLVARQYANGFADVFDFVAPQLLAVRERGMDPLETIVHVQLLVMARHPDSLIQRKCGAATAQEASDRATRVVSAGPVGSLAYQHQLHELDQWLRGDANRRNPGTTADLLAAGLFVCFLTEPTGFASGDL